MFVLHCLDCLDYLYCFGFGFGLFCWSCFDCLDWFSDYLDSLDCLYCILDLFGLFVFKRGAKQVGGSVRRGVVARGAAALVKCRKRRWGCQETETTA